MIVEIALGIVLGCFLLAVGVPLVLAALVGGIWLCVKVVGLCVHCAKPCFDLMVRLLFAPILIAQHIIRTVWPQSPLLGD
jgi:hypothetical protein